MAFIPNPVGLRIDRLAEGQDRHAWLEDLKRIDLGKAQILKIDDRTGVWKTPLAGREVVLKMWEYPTLPGRLKLIFRASRGCRQWRGAQWLIANGFPTAKPLALCTEYGPGGPREWLAIEHLEGRSILDHIADQDLSISQEHAVAKALAEQISDMVAKGRFNRDHKPSNLILTCWEGDKPRIAIIDTVAIRRCRRFDFAAMQRMLASLYIEPLGLGCSPRRTLCMRALDAIQAWDWWPTLSGMIRNHGDPTPRINPRGA